MIAIEGNIASGKSSVISRLRCEFPEATFVDEPVDTWSDSGLLQAMYEGRITRGTFQLVALVTRYSSMFNKSGFVVTERSTASDAIFASMLTDNEKVAYDACHNVLHIQPSHFIFLHVPVDVAIERIKERNRGGEDRIDESYVRRLSDAHDEFFKATPHSFVDATKPLDEVSRAVADAIRSIRDKNHVPPAAYPR